MPESSSFVPPGRKFMLCFGLQKVDVLSPRCSCDLFVQNVLIVRFVAAISAGLVGLCLIYAKMLTGMFQWCVRQSAEVENLVRAAGQHTMLGSFSTRMGHDGGNAGETRRRLHEQAFTVTSFICSCEWGKFFLDKSPCLFNRESGQGKTCHLPSKTANETSQGKLAIFPR